MTDRRDPTGISEPERILVRARRRVAVTGPHDFLRQETVADGKGVSSCVPTSLINAFVGLGLLHPGAGRDIHDGIVREVRFNPDLRSGSFTHLQGDNTGLADLFEGLVNTENRRAVTVGFREGNIFLLTVQKSYEGLQRDLKEGERAYIVLPRQGNHANALIQINGTALRVEPEGPSLEYFTRGWFDEQLLKNPDGTTPVIPIVRHS